MYDSWRKPSRRTKRETYARDWHNKSRIARRDYAIMLAASEDRPRPNFGITDPAEILELDKYGVRYQLKYENQFLSRRRAFRRSPTLHKDQLRGLPRADFDTDGCGVYFLWFGPELVYIGKSNQIGTRLFRHARKEPIKIFTHATWLPAPDEIARSIEGNFVLKYDPPMNMTRLG